MDKHYLFLSSDSSKAQFPANAPGDFTIELPLPYDLQGQWMCGLKDISISVGEDVLYVCSDICEESYAEDTMIPILRALQSSKGKKTQPYFHFDDPMYVKIKPNVLTRLRIFIRDSKLESPTLQDPIVRCILHLKRWK